MNFIEAWIAAWVVPLVIWALISAVDDLVLDAACFFAWTRRRLSRFESHEFPTEKQLFATPEKLIAVFVPAWREHRVIGRMLERNLAENRYHNYVFFVGCYPNDEWTIAAVREIERRHSNVHAVICSKPGPTCKADCLNEIYRGMTVFERSEGVRFELIVIHDAEDIMHRDGLHLINYYSREYDMVQIPILPLPTPPWDFTHGIYCDEFAEFQTKDVPARGLLGGFLPSNGVGTGYSRRSLEALDEDTERGIFDTAVHTEDYVTGLRLHLLGFKQIFVPVRFTGVEPAATREYFPQTLKTAIRQRTRWIIGITLQSWEKYGWRGGPAQVYWFWRDRKGLPGNLITFLVNAIFLYGGASWLWAAQTGTSWRLAEIRGPVGLVSATLAVQAFRVAVRTGCCARIYGWKFACGTPLRMLWGNWINFLATVEALRRYLAARFGPKPLGWLKTDHVYPGVIFRARQTRRIGDLLISSGHLANGDLESALTRKPAGLRVGEYLVRTGRLTEKALYGCLSDQHKIPLRAIPPSQVSHRATRALPAAIIERWQLLPYRVAFGSIFLAGPEIPREGFLKELHSITRLEAQFHLITPANFSQLKQEFALPGPAGKAQPRHQER